MDPLEFLVPLGDIASSVITSMANARAVTETNAQNLALQREQWARDDNAVQRRKADLEAAGFNPILATGQSADSSLAVRMGAPQFSDAAIGSAIERGIRANNAKQQMALTEAQVKAELPKLQFEASVWNHLLDDPTNAIRQANFLQDSKEVEWKTRNALLGKAVQDSNNAKKQGDLLGINVDIARKYGNANAIMGLIGDAVSGAAGLKNIAFPSNRR